MTKNPMMIGLPGLMTDWNSHLRSFHFFVADIAIRNNRGDVVYAFHQMWIAAVYILPLKL
jgi:hypothetical protein